MVHTHSRLGLSVLMKGPAMAGPLRRKAGRKVVPIRRTLSPHSLHMMVQSGVVRRADFGFLPAVYRTRFSRLESEASGSTHDTSSEQSWLTRGILGRTLQSLVLKRS